MVSSGLKTLIMPHAFVTSCSGYSAIRACRLLFSLILSLLHLTLQAQSLQGVSAFVYHDSSTYVPVVAKAASNDRLNSMAVWKSGSFHMEAYFNNAPRNAPVNVKSISKSVLAMIAGLAADRGQLTPTATISTYFPDHPSFTSVPSKKRILVVDLLQMTTGFLSTSQQYTNWTSSGNWADFVLNQPLVFEPGRTMLYSSGNSHLMSVVLSKATGKDLADYARNSLFTPIGVTLYGWDRDPQGYYFGGNNMAFTTLDLVKLGRLILQKGTWNGKSILSEKWIAEMTSKKVRATLSERDAWYGYYWWQQEIEGKTVHFAWGFGGQYIFVVPDLEMVAVFTSKLKSTRTKEHNDFIYVLLKDLIGSKPGPSTFIAR
jgi:CubicO group peptidase (beta-lactamase class C family)